MPSKLSPLVLLVASALPNVGCSSESTPEEKKVVEIFSWWTAEGERDALDALLARFKKNHPDVEVVNTAVAGSETAEDDLEQRLIDRKPPDTFQVTAGASLLRWAGSDPDASSKSILEPLDFLTSSKGWKAAFPDAVIEQVSLDGKVFGVPVNIERNNALFYNKKLFAEHDLSPPTSTAEFLEVAAVLQAAGVTPLALGVEADWPMTIVLWDWLLLEQAGPAYRDAYFHGKASPNDPEIRQVAETALQVLEYTNADADSKDWDDAVNMVFEGEAAMTVMGDWAKGFLASKGWEPGVDFGEVPAPGTAGNFVFSNDTFPLPLGAPHRNEAVDLLTVIGSAEAQQAFNVLKGSIPARTDVDESAFDPLGRTTIEDFRRDLLIPNTSAYVPATYGDADSTASGQFARDRDVDALIAELNRYYDSLTQD